MNQASPACNGRKLFILGSAALCQGIPFAFLFMGVPAILRGLDENLSTITLYSLLLFPWAGRILYAPFLDRVYIKRLGRRRTWLMAGLLTASALLVATGAFIPPGSSPQLMVALFLINLMLSINDTVTGAYASDILEYGEMSWVGTIRLGGNCLGMMLGGGFFLSHYAVLGWQSSFCLLGALTCLLSLPVALHREIAPVHAAARSVGIDRPSLRRFVSSPGMGWFILVEILFTSSLYTGTQIYPPFLIDMGFSNKDIGHFLMFWGYPLGFVVAVAAGWTSRSIRPGEVLLFSMAVGVATQAYALYLAAYGATPTQAVVLLCADMALGSLAGVAYYAILAAFCVGPQAATNNGLLASIGNITPLLIPPLLGRLGDACGYPAMYAVMVGVSLAFFLTVAVVFRVKLSGSPVLDKLNHSRTNSVESVFPVEEGGIDK